MILGIEKEAAVFLVALLDGMLVALAYYVIRVFRRMISHNIFWISVEDLFFWILSAVYVFSEMGRVCAGNIRWYFALGVFLGGFIICMELGKLLKKYIDKPQKKR